MTILVSIADAERFGKVPAPTLRRWVSEGWLENFGTKPYLIDMLEVEKLVNKIGSGRNRATRKKSHAA